MTTLPAKPDYRARVNRQVGRKSAKGRKAKRVPDHLSYLLWRLGVDIIGNGDENYFLFNPNAYARFTASAFVAIVPMLEAKLPEECERYFADRTNKAYLISQRFHKKYYIYDEVNKYRAKSSEHPHNWKPQRLANALQKLYGGTT